MTIAETILVFLGAPAAVIAVVALLVYGPSRARRVPRYRPGIAIALRPVWFLAPRPDASGPAPREQRVQAVLVPAGSTVESTGGARASW
ncbi:MAG: aa3-type cytochrome oxidase subunit CtaJ [Mycobacteriales bacterium]